MKKIITILAILCSSNCYGEEVWKIYRYPNGTVRVYEYQYGNCPPKRPTTSLYILNKPTNGVQQENRGPVNSFFHKIIDLFPHFRFDK